MQQTAFATVFDTLPRNPFRFDTELARVTHSEGGQPGGQSGVKRSLLGTHGERGACTVMDLRPTFTFALEPIVPWGEMPIARYYPLSVIVEEASARILRQIERNILKDPSP
jgi:hypothetical protein